MSKQKKSKKKLNKTDNKKSANKKRMELVAVALVILFALGSAVYFARVKSNSNDQLIVTDSDGTWDGATEEQRRESEELIKEMQNPAGTVEEGRSNVDGGPDDTPETQEISITDLKFEQSKGKVNSSFAVLGADIGVCDFLFSIEGDKPVNRSGPLENGRCSISIPEAEFTRIGEWKLAVYFADKQLYTKVNIK